MIWVIVGIIAAVVVIVAVTAIRRRSPDGVTSFQRHIDALSPEARRHVVDHVQQLDDDEADAPRSADDRRDHGDDDELDDDDDDDEDDVNG